MKAIRILFITIFIFSGFSLSAQEQPYSLTLDEAVKYALEHNKTLMNARDDVSASHHKIREARAQGLPQIEGTLDYLTYFNYELDFGFGGPIVMEDQMNGKIQVTQLLLSGQFWTGLTIAKIAKDLAADNVVRSELDIMESVTNTYYSILVTQRNLDILQENIDNLSKTLAHTENMYKAGVLESSDVDQLRITVNQLINSQKAAERGLQLSFNMLRFQMGVAPDANIVLTDNFESILNAINPAVADSTYDITSNIGYKLAESQVKLSEKQLRLQNMAYIPMLVGYYSYTEKIMTTSFDLSPNHLAGLTLTVPIFSSGSRGAKVSQAKIEFEKSARNLEMTKEQLETQRNQLLFNYQSSLENFQTQNENVDVAKRVLQNVQNKYDQGMVSSLDLTQANGNYLTAQSNFISSVMTLLQAQSALEKLYNKF